MAASILLYLLKANAVLLLFVVAYFGLLRRLTFFTLNRFYLLFALLFAAGYPALPVPALLPAEATPAVAFAVVEAAGSPGAPLVPVAPTVDWATVGVALYAAGAAVLLARLLVQLLSLGRLRRQSRPALVHGLPVRVLAGAVSPFSFGRTIYLNPDQHPAPELAAVLRHEQVHVRQWHTLDVLLTQLALAAAWCNPAAWLLRRALLDNLEYLADHAVLETGLDRRAYQYSLLRLSHGVAGPSLVSHFTFPTLKNRVAMMNTPLSSTGQLARYFVAGPLVLAVALGLAGARAQGAGPVVPAAAASVAHQNARRGPVLYYIDGIVAEKAAFDKLTAANIASVNALEGENAHKLYGLQVDAVVAVTTTSHLNSPAVLTLNKKLGRLSTQVLSKKAPTEAAVAPAEKAQSVRRVHVVSAAAVAPAAVDGPKPHPAMYLDGQPHAQEVSTINPDDIASVNVLKGKQARAKFGDAAKDGAVSIITKANQNRADVLAFNDKFGVANAPAAPEASGTPYLAAPALAYITKHYPDARLLEVTEVPATDGGPARYRALLGIGRRPVCVLFDGQGQFISEVPYTR